MMKLFRIIKDLLSNEKENSDVKFSLEEFLKKREETDEISIKIGSDLTPFTENIIDTIKSFRKEVYEKNGFLLPLIRISQDDFLQENEYQIAVRGEIKINAFTIPNKEYATEEIKEGISKITELYLSEIFSAKMIQAYISDEYYNKNNYWLVSQIQDFFTITSIKTIFVYLLQNGISIKNTTYIFEKIVEYASEQKDKCFFRAPIPIAKSICKDFKNKELIEEVKTIIK